MSDVVKCPYCGYVDTDTDSWEILVDISGEGSGVVACDHCGFDYVVGIRIAYFLTRKLTEEERRGFSFPSDGEETNE